MQDVVVATNQLTDRFAIGDLVFDACKQYWKDTAVTNKDLACSLVRKDIRESQGGIAGKRAGLVCALMSECNTAALAGSPCSMLLRNTSAAADLDMCTVEGIDTGALVAGILNTTGETDGSFLPLP
jgi:hypothetical protein